MKVLEVKNLQVNLKTKYGEVEAIRDLSFDLKKGEILSIVGESGSGKSVLCRSILKLLPENGYVKNGDILLNGTNICNLTDKMMSKVRGKEISMIFQDSMTSLNPTISVGKQISEAVRVHNKVTIEEAKRRAIELIDFVGIDESESRYNQYPYEFSGGMRQRIAIAIALACNPKILIADEPTTALDSIMQNKILDLIKSIQKKTNISIIFITHDMEVVNKIADRIAVMYAGKIVEKGKKEDIFSNPIHPYTVGLMSSRASFNMDKEYLLTIEGVQPKLLNPPKAMIARDEIKAKEEKLIINEEEKLLEIKNLKQYFTLNNKKIVKAIDDVSLDIYKGEFLGLIGESGSGKSTLGKSIVGINSITDGEIKYNGITISGKKLKKTQREIISKKIQFIFQDSTSSLNSRMTVKNIIEEPMRLQKLYSSKAEREKAVYDLLEVVGLDRSSINKYPYDLSGGQRQRVSIARAISTKPECIIADEPIASLDVSMQAQIINLFKKLKSNKNLTFIFISHDLSMVRYISDRIAVIYKGKIVEVAPTYELYSNPIHPYTKMLLNSNLQDENNLFSMNNKFISKGCNEEVKWIEVSKKHFVLLDNLI